MNLRKNFFANVRSSLFNNKLNVTQVIGIEKMLDYWEGQYKDWPLPCLAYTLATAYHETNRTFGPIREYGRGKGYKYPPYYGRGLVQLTWKDNYAKMSKVVGKDLIKEPDLVLDLNVAVPIIFIGMERGLFTGKAWADYLMKNKKDYVGARRIINGVDRAKLIAGYAEEFENALRA